MSWTFGTVTLGDPKSYDAREEKAQALDFTAAGSPRAYDKGYALYRCRVVLEDLTTAEKAALLTYFHTTANGVVNTWTLTDHNSATYTARFAEPDLKFETAGVANRWNVTLELLTSALVAT